MSHNRRDFLKGLLGAAVLAALPSATSAEVEQKSQWLLDQFKLSMNGVDPDAVSLTDMGNGWHQLQAVFNKKNGDGLWMDFRHMNGGQGLRFGPEHDPLYVDCTSEDVRATNATLAADQGVHTFSMMVKIA